MNTGKPQIVAVFRPPLLTQAVSCVIILFQLIILVFGKNGFLNWLQDFQGDFLLLLPGIGLLIVLWMLASLIIVDKLLITEEGLIWRRFGFKHRVSWNEMKYFGFSQRLMPYSRRSDRLWGIHTRTKHFIPLERYVIVPRVSLLSEGKDLEKFRHSRLGLYLYHYAPHLFGRAN